MDRADFAQDKIDAEQAQRVAARVVYYGVSAGECIECGELIPSARQVALPGCLYCVDCVASIERGEVRP